jgi:hypothetical protein
VSGLSPFLLAHTINFYPFQRRFLRARQFDVAKAQEMFDADVVWRKEHDADKLYAAFPEDEFEASKKYYPRFTGHRDKVSAKILCWPENLGLAMTQQFVFVARSTVVCI